MSIATKHSLLVILSIGLTLIGFVLFWRTLAYLYANPSLILSLESNSLETLIPLGIMLGAVTLPSALLVTLQEGSSGRVGIYALAGLLCIPFFYSQPELVIMLTGGTILSLTLFDRWCNRDLGNQITFQPYGIFRRNIGGFITTMALVLSLGYYLSSRHVFTTLTISIPEAFISNVVQHFQSASPTSKGTTDELLENPAVLQELERKVREELEKRGITDENQIQTQLSRAKEAARTQLNQQLTQTPAGNAASNLTKQVKGEVESLLNGLVGQYRQFIPVLYSIGLFALFQFLSPFVSLLVAFLTTAMLSILQAMGIIALQRTTITVERLVIAGSEKPLTNMPKRVIDTKEGS